MTYEGGCQNHMNFRLEKFDDREYTMEECYTMCSLMKECGGFFLKDSPKYCQLYRKGCKSTPIAFKYYSLDDCRFGMFYQLMDSIWYWSKTKMR